ncbi:MAG: glucose-6-phosphate dehydrogenase [Qingshengfaniella sp.]
MVSRIIPVEEFDLVIFGGTGDLAQRKILPSLFRRYRSGQMPEAARITGVARAELGTAGYRDFVRETLESFVPDDQRQTDQIDGFLVHIDYVSVDAQGETGWRDLRDRLRSDVTRAFYFSVAPALFGDIAARLHEYGLADHHSRIVVEKPFGRDLDTARALNRSLAEHFDEQQIYRIDHYLGKETVQNLMAVRFANILFEPLWNAQFIDHVQITVAETVGVGGRGDYYDGAGAMRDMVQNHIMQLLCLIAMEPPSKFEPDDLRDEKLKVIRALEPVDMSDVVRGQYQADGDIPAYPDDVGRSDSTTESFIAMKLRIANWRWQGTPFYIRTGKRMRARVSEIVIRFKEPPHSIFGRDSGLRANELAIRLQPNEGMDLRVTIKEPGPGGMRLIDVPLDMTFAEALGPEVGDVPDAYERLIMDVIRGNQTLFMRGDEVEAAWAWSDPIIASWEETGDKPIAYDAGTSGPEEALALLHRDGRRWREVKA